MLAPQRPPPPIRATALIRPISRVDPANFLNFFSQKICRGLLSDDHPALSPATTIPRSFLFQEICGAALSLAITRNNVGESRPSITMLIIIRKKKKPLLPGSVHGQKNPSPGSEAIPLLAICLGGALSYRRQKNPPSLDEGRGGSKGESFGRPPGFRDLCHEAYDQLHDLRSHDGRVSGGSGLPREPRGLFSLHGQVS